MKRIIILIMLINSCLAFAQEKALTVRAERYNYDKQIYETIVEKVPYLDKSKYIPNAIYVKFKKSVLLSNSNFLKQSISVSGGIKDISLKQVGNFSKSAKLQSVKQSLDRLYKVYYSDSIDPYVICEKLNTSQNIEYAVPVFRRQMREITPNDELYTEQWYLPAINIGKAWEMGAGDSTIIIGIVDSGVDILHKDLIPNLWVNKGEIPNDGIDNDGNGFVDDVNGWDFAGNITLAEAVAGKFKPDNNPKPNTSANSHGSNVAGIACAATNNGIGIASPANKCKLLSVKCATDDLEYKDILEGFEGILYAAQNGADIINCSWGGPGYNSAEKDIIDAVIFDYGAVIVAAGVNFYADFDDEGDYPISYGNIIGISAINVENNFSRCAYGVSMCLFAPGFSMLSTMNGGHYAKSSGTSLACPVVASVAAMIKSRHPKWGYKEIYHQLRSSAVPFPIVADTNRKKWFGKLDAYAALTNNWDSSNDYKKTPGVSFVSMNCNEKSSLINPGLNHCKVTIKNYLSTAENLTVTITTNSPHLSVLKNSYFISKIGGADTASIPVDFVLNESNPWFIGEYSVLVEYKADNYYNVEIVKIPVDLKTQNRFRLAKDFTAFEYPLWNTAHAQTNNYLFAGGYFPNDYSGIIMRWGGGGDVVKYLKKTIPTTSFGINKDVALFGTSAVDGGNGPMILKMNFSTNELDTTLMEAYMGDVNKVFMFDGLNGIAFGSLANNGKWFIARTTDGAATWVGEPISIAPLEDEGNFWAATYTDKSKLSAFGTNRGRVLYSTDAQNWSVGTVWDKAKIEYITYVDPKNALCIYSNNSELSDSRYSAFTTNGGQTWTRNSFDFNAWKTIPVYLFSPEGSGYAVAQCYHGEVYMTKDLGKSWQPCLGWQTQAVSTGFGMIDNDRVKVWQLGMDLYYLDFLKSSSKYFEGLAVNVDTLDFGVFAIDSTVSREFEISNVSSNPINIHSIIISNPDVFVSSNQIPTVLLPNEKFTCKISAHSLTEATYGSNINFQYDIYNLDIPIKAKIVDPESVVESDKLLEVYPNPASDYIVVKNLNATLGNFTIKIIDLFGKIVFEKSGINSNFTNIETTKFENGVYIIELNDGQRVLHKKIIIHAPLLNR